MEKDGKIEEKQRYNAPFIAACKSLMAQKRISQQKMAEMLGTTSGHISDWKAGRKRVSRDMMDSLIRVSCGKLRIEELDPELIEDKQEKHNSEPYPTYETLDMIDSISYLISGIIQNSGRMKEELSDIKQILATSIEENKRLRETIIADRAVIYEVRNKLATSIDENICLRETIEDERAIIYEMHNNLANSIEENKKLSETIVADRALIYEMRNSLATSIEENKRLRETIEDERAVIYEIRNELANIRMVALSRYNTNIDNELPLAAEHQT